MREDLHQAMARQIMELSDRHETSPDAVRDLISEFPEARLHDWGCSFCMSQMDLNGRGMLVAMVADLLLCYPNLTLTQFAQAIADGKWMRNSHDWVKIGSKQRRRS